MGLWPTQGDEKASVRHPLLSSRYPFFSSQPEESRASGPPKVIKNASVRHPHFIDPLPFPCHPDRSEPGFPATQP
jgi:hypothetical protein